MKNICENCKYCERKIEIKRTKVHYYYLGKEYKYFCRFMPNEIEKKPDDWCGQFKSNFDE
ncbi:MAG: hypothetical protein IKP65_05500 [Alphaproteobacteria bacterium]|nr:hypothetical protein [Alphaproteobacteria bacterium]